jgi:DNA (cytosine-5)-methyltransferase 1
MEPYAAQWLRNLIDKGLIAKGEVDERSILDVDSADLRGVTQCHFFAGIGGWSLAARLAGWPDERPLWTGSAPCQPFSTAGQQKGQADERHLWPVFFGLIRACRPPVVMGEQVAAAVGKDWLDGVSTDLEGIGYACGAVVVPACAVDAPHRRDRLWFVGSLEHAESVGGHGQVRGHEREEVRETVGASGDDSSDVADADIGARRERYEPDMFGGWANDPEQARMGGGDFDVADAVRVGRQGPGALGRPSDPTAGDDGQASDAVNAGAGFWVEHRWAIGADGKARRVGSNFRRLVDGFSAGVDGLRPGCYAEAEKEMIRYGQETSTRPTEIMRAVWDRVLSQPATYGPMGEQTGICSAEILLAFLCQLNRSSSQSDLALSGSEELGAAMRSVRERARYARPPYQWGRGEQCPNQHSDALQALSWVLAQHAEAAWSAYRQTNAAPMALLAHNVPARVGKLRALGNAIVPQVAAEVIGAYLDAAP